MFNRIYFSVFFWFLRFDDDALDTTCLYPSGWREMWFTIKWRVDPGSCNVQMHSYLTARKTQYFLCVSANFVIDLKVLKKKKGNNDSRRTIWFSKRLSLLFREGVTHDVLASKYRPSWRLKLEKIRHVETENKMKFSGFFFFLL